MNLAQFIAIFHSYGSGLLTVYFPTGYPTFLLHIILVGTILLYRLFSLALSCIPVIRDYEFVVLLEAVTGGWVDLEEKEHFLLRLLPQVRVPQYF